MKHIKLFENFDIPLYWQVDELNQDKRKEEKFEQRYIDQIESRLKEGFSIYTMNTFVGFFGENDWSSLPDSLCRIDYRICKPGCKACVGLGVHHSPQTDFYVDIFQLDDEYFDLEYLDAISPDYQKYRFNSEYYRCDGIDGLIKFLEDEKIIK